MRYSKPLLIGLIVFGFCRLNGLLTPTASQAGQQSGQSDKNQNQYCEEVPPWRGVIPGDQRFIPTFIDANGVAHAYCDRQTGLVIQASPGVPPDASCGNTDTCTWYDARFYCANLAVEGQKGWRLLSVAELASLVDVKSGLCANGGPCLPDGHPFQDVQAAFYWSASSDADITADAWSVGFIFGRVDSFGKTFDLHAWCGRGAMNPAVY